MGLNRIAASLYSPKKLTNSRTFKAPLKDGSEASLKIGTKAYECVITKNNQIQEAKRAYNPKGLGQDFVDLMGNLQANAKEGFDFLGEFLKAMIAR